MGGKCKLTNEQIYCLCRDYENGIPPTQLTAKYDVAQNTIHNYIKTYGVPLQHPEKRGKVKSQHTPKSDYDFDVALLIAQENRVLRTAISTLRKENTALKLEIARLTPQKCRLKPTKSVNHTEIPHKNF